MDIATIRPSELAIPFHATFKHASAERARSSTLWVTAKSHRGVLGYGESCPRPYVTAETPHTAAPFIAEHLTDWQTSIHDVNDLRQWVSGHRPHINTHPATWCAVELALLDLLAQENACGVEALLGATPPTGDFRYTAVLGDASTAAFESQLARYIEAGFTDYKIKLAGVADRDAEKIRQIKNAGIAPDHVRADANNLWRDADTAIAYLSRLAFPFAALEEPLQPGDIDGLRTLSAALNTRIVLDESLSRIEQIAPLTSDAERWIVNARISKMGGLLRTLELIDSLRTHGLRLIVGAHVGETSLLTRVALTAAAAGRDILIAQEGAFGTQLLVHDVVSEPLMFGRGGKLHWHAQETTGWGLAYAVPESYLHPL